MDMHVLHEATSEGSGEQSLQGLQLEHSPSTEVYVCQTNIRYLASIGLMHMQVLEKKILKGVYHVWAGQPSWSCDKDHLNKLSFQCPTESPYETEFNWPSSFRGENVDRRTDDGRRRDWYTISSPMSLRLR